MKFFYTLLAAASLLLFTPATARASRPNTDAPTETASKAPANAKRIAAKATASATRKLNSLHHLHRATTALDRVFLVFSGLDNGKTVTSPAQRNRQLYAHQKRLKAKTMHEAKARRRRAAHPLR